ncbi:MAG: aldehyde dehydrogenase family protein [Bifidobacteriaceae bacterium]|jgi:aldehyde dehydrogenase (NAD+)|nr:aldehyde dehydrogenase family protein [Bifidobacteriaceae bacterium]
MKTYDKQFIGGEWVEGTGTPGLENRNPFTGELIYAYTGASKQDLDAAYAAAAAAQPAWAATPPAAKQALLGKVAEAIAGMKDEVYACMVEEGGSTRPKADFEFFVSQDICHEAQAFPYMMDGRIMPSNIPGKDNYIYKEPKGVIGVIAPWNVPLVLAMRSVAPAIACGNAVVMKPATDTPGSAFLMAEFFERAGLPAGVLNVVAGRGSEIGDAFVAHPVPSLISFTGSTAVGTRIGEVASGQLKDISLELGGNNSMLVMPDADLDKAVAAALFGAFFHQGQVCMALNRIVVVGAAHDAFVEKLVAATREIPVGDPADPKTFIGPIISQAQVASIEGFIEGTIAWGATVALEGRTGGPLIHPWIFTDVTNDAPAARHEVFGPVCCVLKAKDEDEAVAIINDTEYGLSNCVFTADLYRGMAVARRLESGMVHVNDQSINDEPHVMFGGEKHSGVGRFNAQWVVDKFTRDRWVSVQREYRF